MRRNVFTIAPGAPFLPTFVDALLAGDILPTISRASPPLAMARATIYVPTQRAGRALAAQFARAFISGSALLPRILPLGGLDESETAALFSSEDQTLDADAPPIDELERRLLLARLILQWSSALRGAILSVDPTGAPVLDESEPFLVASSPANAFALAAELGALIDEFAIEDVAGAAIETLAGDFDQYWAITTRFLRIALNEWPAILAERERIDAVTRRKRLIEAQIAALPQQAARAPVIAIGSTGAQPTTARLLAAIAAQPNGAVVLPGLDCDMADEAFARIGVDAARGDEPAFTHPQTMLKRLLATMNLRRDDVRALGAMSPALSARRALVAQAMLPADATGSWRGFRFGAGATFADALADVAVLEAPDERLEALTLALFMREALEAPNRTVALITPDRAIARRVAAELQRFAIDIDDSGGTPLATTRIGALARLIASIGANGADMVSIAALLAHPLTQLGMTRAEVAALAPAIEIGVLRVVGADGESWAARADAARSLAREPHAHPAARRIDDGSWDVIAEALARLDAALAPLAFAGDLASHTRAHRACLEALVAGNTQTEDDGAAPLFDLFDRLSRADAPLDLDAANYAALFDRIAFETILRGPRRAHPRLKILGPLEARLIDADLILLAGLDEGVWPPAAEAGPFLNRSMRKQLGLSPLERRIGQSAHDVTMALGAKSVVLSRAAKRGGAPTVASRFLSRLAALAGDALAPCRARGDAMLAIAAALDTPGGTKAIERPQPRPPVALRPHKLSVTRIERLRRDPYAIYAETILKLVPLAPLGAAPGAREIGMAIHEALRAFVDSFPHGAPPENSREILRALARARLGGFLDDPAFASFSWPRIEVGLDHALAFERTRRAQDVRIFVETRGEWRLTLADGAEFRLTGVADRIEVDRHGEAHVFDYKTGRPPSGKQVVAGWSPQLTLEAAMIEAGAFADVGAHPVVSAAFVGLVAEPKTHWLGETNKPFPQIVAEHRAQLVEMLNQFRDPATPYPSRPFVAFLSETGDFDHLARVKEWSRGGGDGE